MISFLCFISMTSHRGPLIDEDTLDMNRYTLQIFYKYITVPTNLVLIKVYHNRRKSFPRTPCKLTTEVDRDPNNKFTYYIQLCANKKSTM